MISLWARTYALCVEKTNEPLSILLQEAEKHPVFREETPGKLLERKYLHVKGLAGSAHSLFIAHLSAHSTAPTLVIADDPESAEYLFHDLHHLCLHKEVVYFPSSFKRSVLYGKPEPDHLVMRTGVLDRLLSEKDPPVVVTCPEALVEKVLPGREMEQNRIILRTGESLAMDDLHSFLAGFSYRQVDFVQEPGEYAIRGSIIDVFSYSSEDPYRIDFAGNRIETLRTFDIEDQLSREKQEEISVVSNLHVAGRGHDRILFTETLSPKTLVWSTGVEFLAGRINDLYQNTPLRVLEEWTDDPEPDRSRYLSTGSALLKSLKKFRVAETGQRCYFPPDRKLTFHTEPQPPFRKNFELLVTDLIDRQLQGYRLFFLTSNPRQGERLNQIFRDMGYDIDFHTLQGILHEGFVDHDLKIACYTDHQVFDRYHRVSLRRNAPKKAALTLQEISSLKPGDYVVHTDHGIGVFGGLETIDVGGKKQETVRLVYRDQDILHVSIHSLHKVSRYKGKDESPPRIHKLGSVAWQNLKKKTKSRVKDIARELIALYAQRRMKKGFTFSPDTYLQQELEASFIYEDTPDQLAATRAVKEGMESPAPMDRLVCGDVGFGKTEVAIRAAFKAVADNKQVAVLVPTTVLALQHHTTFTGRLKDFPCTVEMISRLKKPAEQKKILRRLQEGKIDIIIGTHRLVGADVKFRNLGLLIIDEEQKFGVAVKEKLKAMKLNVDTLTLTATPIPRTLQFSLMGARDLSVINTPPPNRYPIITELHTFNEDLIREGIGYEVSRNGQVFFIHNRVENIRQVEDMIRRICPGVSTVVAHGQMEGSKLERIMLDFIRGDYDVLVSTTIIESGMDIPNANTIFINQAHHYGLSDLHQLRGRVGRSNRKAFCYLLAPPLSTLTPEARRRLKAIEDFSELGSGFNIAMQDLDIRGAGNLLGAEQSGFIAEIGLETYQQILDEAMMELRETEFRDLAAGPQKSRKEPETTEEPRYVTDCHIDTDMELLFPESYIGNVSERIRLYREMDNIDTEEGIRRFEAALTDRFGPPPEPTRELLNVIRLRQLAIRLGFEKIILKNGQMVTHFLSNPLSPYYQSPVFSRILSFVQKQSKKYRMKEGEKRLTLTVAGIKTVKEAIGTLKNMLPEATRVPSGL